METAGRLVRQFLRTLFELTDRVLQIGGIHVAGLLPRWILVGFCLITRIEKLKASIFWAILGLRLRRAKDIFDAG